MKWNIKVLTELNWHFFHSVCFCKIEVYDKADITWTFIVHQIYSALVR